MNNLHLSIVPKNSNRKTLQIEFKKRNGSKIANEYLSLEDDGTVLTLTSATSGGRVIEITEDKFVGGYEIVQPSHCVFLSYAEIFDLFIALNSLYSRDNEIESISEIWQTPLNIV